MKNLIITKSILVMQDKIETTNNVPDDAVEAIIVPIAYEVGGKEFKEMVVRSKDLLDLYKAEKHY